MSKAVGVVVVEDSVLPPLITLVVVSGVADMFFLSSLFLNDEKNG